MCGARAELGPGPDTSHTQYDSLDCSQCAAGAVCGGLRRGLVRRATCGAQLAHGTASLGAAVEHDLKIKALTTAALKPCQVERRPKKLGS